MITMIDIDRVVIDAAKIHLRGICGDAMDKEEGTNYKVGCIISSLALLQF